MAAWKMPPPIKIYEAIGAIGDGRVRAVDDTNRRWEVVSSDHAKVYSVELSDDDQEISSNDNASYWQGYLGYPGVAALIACGRIPLSAASRSALAGIPWKNLNANFKSDYDRTLDEVARVVETRGGDFSAVRAEADALLESLGRLHLMRGARRRPPRERNPT
jgi:hypothetical protein